MLRVSLHGIIFRQPSVECVVHVPFCKPLQKLLSLSDFEIPVRHMPEDQIKAVFHMAERNFLLSKGHQVESGRQKTKEVIVLRGKFLLMENGLYGNRERVMHWR